MFSDLVLLVGRSVYPQFARLRCSTNSHGRVSAVVSTKSFRVIDVGLFFFFFSMIFTFSIGTRMIRVRWKIATLKPRWSDASRFRVFSRCFSSANRRRRTIRITTRTAVRIAYGRPRLSCSILTKVSVDCRSSCSRFEGIGRDTKTILKTDLNWSEVRSKTTFPLFQGRPQTICSVGATVNLKSTPPFILREYFLR